MVFTISILNLDSLTFLTNTTSSPKNLKALPRNSMSLMLLLLIKHLIEAMNAQSLLEVIGRK